MRWLRKKIHEECGKNYSLSYQEFCAMIFFQPGGTTLRLKSYGWEILSNHYPSHIVHIVDKSRTRDKMPSKHYVFLTRYCKAPYYIGLTAISFFDEEEAMVFKLCDGDIDNVKKITD